jgi:hypothetical protein
MPTSRRTYRAKRTSACPGSRTMVSMFATAGLSASRAATLFSE